MNKEAKCMPLLDVLGKTRASGAVHAGVASTQSISRTFLDRSGHMRRWRSASGRWPTHRTQSTGCRDWRTCRSRPHDSYAFMWRRCAGCRVCRRLRRRSWPNEHGGTVRLRFSSCLTLSGTPVEALRITIEGRPGEAFRTCMARRSAGSRRDNWDGRRRLTAGRAGTWSGAGPSSAKRNVPIAVSSRREYRL